MALIGIISDFGARGLHYIAEMKGVALQINPQCIFIDIIHDITPFSIIEAAYVLQTVIFTYPKETVFVCVVDPGVGSDRDILAVELNTGHHIIGPDNGIFSYFALHHQIKLMIRITESEFFNPAVLRLKKPSRIQKSKNNGPDFNGLDSDELDFSEDFPFEPEEGSWNDFQETLAESVFPTEENDLGVSTTFHGRDIMMPVAAHLTKGLDLFALGEIKDECILIPDLEPEISEDKHIITGIVQFVDTFSNIITNIDTADFNFSIQGDLPTLELKFQDQSHELLRTATFAGNLPGQLLLIDGSSGFLELCYNQQKAGETLQMHVGDKFEIYIYRSVYDGVPE